LFFGAKRRSEIAALFFTGWIYMAKDKAKKKEEETEEKDEGAADAKDAKNAKNAKAKDTPEAEEGEAGEGGEEGAETPKKSRKKIIIIGVLALLLIIGGVAGAYFSGLFGSHGEGATTAGGKSGEAAKAVYYTMPEFLINLNTSGKSSSFLKTTIILEVAKQEDVPLIEANLPRVVDSVNTYLRELRASDLSGSAGIQRLREELLARCNKSLAPVKINDVLFKEIVVQ
jgi:flagellar FliL protein